ncbi:MAG: MarR family transcriptional regulator [Oscillospiraceae bacterium]
MSISSVGVFDSPYEEILNTFFVDTFNNILQAEEKALLGVCENNLSITEFHVIEKVYIKQNEGQNSMKEIATSLNITQGSLTVSLGVLEKKGYVKKVKDSIDKRITLVFLTDEGIKINKKHMDFHKKMIDAIIKDMGENEVINFMKSIGIVSEYFKNFNSL